MIESICCVLLLICLLQRRQKMLCSKNKFLLSDIKRKVSWWRTRISESSSSSQSMGSRSKYSLVFWNRNTNESLESLIEEFKVSTWLELTRISWISSFRHLTWYNTISWAMSFLFSSLFILSYVSVLRTDQPRNCVKAFQNNKCESTRSAIKYFRFLFDATCQSNSYTSMSCSSRSSNGLPSFLL